MCKLIFMCTMYTVHRNIYKLLIYISYLMTDIRIRKEMAKKCLVQRKINKVIGWNVNYENSWNDNLCRATALKEKLHRPKCIFNFLLKLTKLCESKASDKIEILDTYCIV